MVGSLLGSHLAVGVLVSEMILECTANVLSFLDDARAKVFVSFADGEGVG